MTSNEPVPKPSPLDRLEFVSSYIDALSSLVGSCRDLHTVSADGLALLLDLIRDESDSALAALRAESTH